MQIMSSISPINVPTLFLSAKIDTSLHCTHQIHRKPADAESEDFQAEL